MGDIFAFNTLAIVEFKLRELIVCVSLDVIIA